MERKLYEQMLQDYLIINNGSNLQRINASLSLIEPEHKFKGGRIDILAKNKDSLVGIELKSLDYNTRGISAQLLNYINYLSPQNGIIYFIAPKIKYGTYSTLKNFYDENKIKFFEFEKNKKEYSFKEIFPELLDDRRRIFEHINLDKEEYNKSYLQNSIYESKIKKGLAIIVKDKKKYKLIESIIDSKNSKQKQLEIVADSAVDILFSKNQPFIKTAYELFKML